MHDHSRDFELIALIRDNQEEYVEELIQRYHKSIWAIIHKLVKPPAPSDIDTEDLYQEGLIGIFEAIRTYDQQKDASFKTYANILIDRKMEVFKYVQSYYRCFMQEKSIDNYPKFII